MPYPSTIPRVTFYSGDTVTWPTYTLREDGVPLDLSVYTWAAQWRPTPDSTEFVTLTLDLSQAAAGKITPSASAAQTAGMTTTGVWDLQSTLGGVVRTWLVGPTTCQKDVTRLG